MILNGKQYMAVVKKDQNPFCDDCAFEGEFDLCQAAPACCKKDADFQIIKLWIWVEIEHES